MVPRGHGIHVSFAVPLGSAGGRQRDDSQPGGSGECPPRDGRAPMIGAGQTISRFTAAPARHASDIGRDEPLLTRILGVTGLMLWEADEQGLAATTLQGGVSPSLTAAPCPADPGPGGRWTEIVHPADRERVCESLAAEETARTGRPVEYRLLMAGGGFVWVRHWVLHRLNRRDGMRRLQGVILPIPEQRRLELECLRLGERERARIGQELHDDLCQVLAGLAFMLHRVGGCLGRADPALASEVDALNTEVTAVTERVRTMARGLFPAGLDHAGLRRALQDCAEHARQRFAIGVDLELPRRLPPHSPEQILHVYRIVQEAVSNAVRHGAARHLRLAVASAGHAVNLRIEDDGRGFPGTNGEPRPGIGLQVMAYRARTLGGEIRFSNHRPHGGAVYLSYPAPAASVNDAEPTPLP